MGMRTPKKGIFLINTVVCWNSPQNRTPTQVKRSHYKQILYHRLHFQMEEDTEAQEIFLCLLNKTRGCESRWTLTSGLHSGLVWGPPGLADLDPTWPQFYSLLLFLKSPTPFRHQSYNLAVFSQSPFIMVGCWKRRRRKTGGGGKGEGRDANPILPLGWKVGYASDHSP